MFNEIIYETNNRPRIISIDNDINDKRIIYICFLLFISLFLHFKMKDIALTLLKINLN